MRQQNNESDTDILMRDEVIYYAQYAQLYTYSMSRGSNSHHDMRG